MSDVQQPSYYTNIPASIRYDNDIPPNAKLLYGEIGCLSNKFGYCFATNEYFAKLYNLSEDRISKLIHLLEKKGYIEIFITRNSNNFIIDRKIKLLDPGLLPNEKVKNNDSSVKNNYGEKLKITFSNGKNDKDNINTNNNNTLNTNTISMSEYEQLKKENEELKKQLSSSPKGSERNKKSKNEYKTLKDSDFYTSLFCKYKKVFYSVRSNGVPLAKNYKQQIDNALVKLREIGMSDEQAYSKMIEAISNAPSCDYWKNQASCSFAYIVSDIGLNKLTGCSNSVEVKKGQSAFVDKQRDYSDIEEY